RPQSLTSPFDPGKVGDLVYRVAEAGEQGQPGCALGLVRIVHRHFVEEAVDGRAQDGERGHGRFEVLGLHRRTSARLGRVQRFDQRLFSRFWRIGVIVFSPLLHLGGDYRGEIGIVDQGQRVLLAGLRDLAFDALPVLLLEDVRRALVAGEQVGAVLGLDEVLQSFHTGEKPHEVVFVPEREDRVDQVVTDAGFALLDFETIGEEALDILLNLAKRKQTYASFNLVRG